jgi:hypothetical protein
MWKGLIWLKMTIVLGSFEYGNKPIRCSGSQKPNGLSGGSKKLQIGELRNLQLRLNMKRGAEKNGSMEAVKWTTQRTALSFLVHFGSIYARSGHMPFTMFS